MENDRRRNFHHRRHEIIGKRTCQKAAVRRVGVLFVKCGSDRLRETASDLAVDPPG